MNIRVREQRDWFILFIFLAAFSIRTIYIFQVLQFPLTEYLTRSNTFDQFGFDNRALFIASGNWFGGDEVFGKEPLYSYFLACIYKISGYSHPKVYLIQSLLTSLGVVLLYRITSQLLNRVSGYIASFILAFYSVSIFYDALLLRASLLMFLNILLFYLLVRAKKNNSVFLWFASGIALGLSVVTRHNILPPFILSFIFFTIRPFKGAIKNALIFTAGLFIILFPVLARNYVVSDHKKVGISSEINAFWVGNTHASSGIDFEPASSEYRELKLKSGGSIKKSAYLFFNEIRKGPKGYLRLYIRKIWMFFNGYEAPSNTNLYLYKEEFPTVLRWPLFGFRLISALGILGVILSIFRTKRPYMAYIFLAVLSGSVILFHIQARFRLPAVPFYIIFSSYFIYFVLNMIRSKRYFISGLAIMLSMSFYILLRPDTTYAGFRPEEETIRFFDRTNLAMAYIDNYIRFDKHDSLDLAMRQCNLSIRENRRFSNGYRLRGYIHLLEKDYTASEREYKKAIIYSNHNPFLYNEMACVYYEKKDMDRASVFINRALHLFPQNKLFQKNLSLIPHEGN